MTKEHRRKVHAKMVKKARRPLLARARKLLRANPSWRDREVNVVLRRDYGGKWLKAITLIGERTCAVKGKAQDYKTMTSEGFSPFETNYILSGLTVPLSSPAVKAMRDQRIEAYKWMLAKGLSHERIQAHFDRRYRNPKASPFDFLDDVYWVSGHRRGHMRPSEYRSVVAHTQESRRRQAQRDKQKKADRAGRFYRKLV